MNLVIKDEKILRTKSEEVKLPLSQEDKDLLKDMYRFVKDSNNAVGLAAIQFGVPKRMCVIIDGQGHNYKLVNPKIISRSTKQSYCAEGCLSIDKDIKTPIGRSETVKVVAYDAIQNKGVVINTSGYLARILQHEIDHMDGILFTDYLTK